MDAALACTVLDYGDHALMLQCDSTADAMAWTDALRAAALPGVVDIVAASRTVLVKLDAPRYQGVTRQRLRRLRVTPEAVAAADHRCDLVIDVVYDGPDLAEVARCTGLTTAAVINAHTATGWRAGFSGSAPGRRHRPRGRELYGARGGRGALPGPARRRFGGHVAGQRTRGACRDPRAGAFGLKATPSGYVARCRHGR